MDTNKGLALIFFIHGALWAWGFFVGFYPLPYIAYLGLSNAGLYVPIAMAVNFWIGLLQVALGLFLFFPRWWVKIWGSTGVGLVVTAIVLVVMYLSNGSIFVHPEF